MPIAPAVPKAIPAPIPPPPPVPSPVLLPVANYPPAVPATPAVVLPPTLPAPPKRNLVPVAAPVALQPPAVFPSGEPAAPVGTRVILFQKPAETPPEIKPVDPKPMVPLQTTRVEPSRDEVFRLSGDDERQITVLKLAPPDKPRVADPIVARVGTTPPMRALLEPGFVVHRRLYFEDKNSERYGWELGLAQPLLSLAIFYKDVLLYPAHLGSNMRERYSTNAGKYLPGSPVPYYIYPPEITVVGFVIGSAAIVGTVFLLQ